MSTFKVLQPMQTKITKLAFSNRFTMEEEVALETAAESSPQVRVFNNKVNRATYIDLSLPQTIQFVNALVPDFITQERADEILNSPVQSGEEYTG